MCGKIQNIVQKILTEEGNNSSILFYVVPKQYQYTFKKVANFILSVLQNISEKKTYEGGL